MRALLPSLLLVVALDAAACVCITSDPKSAFKGAHVVFLGEVVENGDDVVRMRVIEAFKAADADVIEISMMRMTSCSYPGATPPGSRHLIYGWRDESGQLTAGQCSRSAPVERAECDLRYLRSRAAWWRLPLSSFRLFHWLGVRGEACSAAVTSAAASSS